VHLRWCVLYFNAPNQGRTGKFFRGHGDAEFAWIATRLDNGEREAVESFSFVRLKAFVTRRIAVVYAEQFASALQIKLLKVFSARDDIAALVHDFHKQMRDLAHSGVQPLTVG